MEESGQLKAALHDLCQPLTTLQCTLEMALLVDTLEKYREAAELALAQCTRFAESVRSMREIIRVVMERPRARGTQMDEET